MITVIGFQEGSLCRIHPEDKTYVSLLACSSRIIYHHCDSKNSIPEI